MNNLDMVKQLNERGLYILFSKICSDAYASNQTVGFHIFRFNRDYWKHWLNEEYNPEDDIWEYVNRNLNL